MYTCHRQVPSWQAWKNGYNDRFVLGQRGAVLDILSRLDTVADFCREKNQPLHSEKFLKWVIESYRSRAGGKEVEVLESENITFRRVRSNGVGCRTRVHGLFLPRKTSYHPSHQARSTHSFYIARNRAHGTRRYSPTRRTRRVC